MYFIRTTSVVFPSAMGSSKSSASLFLLPPSILRPPLYFNSVTNHPQTVKPYTHGDSLRVELENKRIY
jgi:hypothetical protein